MDDKSLTTLEFDKVRRRLAEYTSFSAGEALALSLRPTTEATVAERWQAETAEAVLLFDRGAEATIGGTRDVRPAVANAERGFTLLPEDLLAIRATIVAGRNLQRALMRLAQQYPRLADIAELIEECPGIVSAIGQALDERGDILDSASPDLARIRAQLRVAYSRIQEKLQKIISSPQGAFLQEPIITMRAGRYVVPLRADARGRIPGIVHDHSGSGATLWIEPMATVELNNDYRSLQIQEEEEIQRILAELSARVAAQGEAVNRLVERMAELDLIFARARYASATNAVQPDFVAWRRQPPPRPPRHANERAKWTPPPASRHPGSTIWIRAARHPLLDPATVVPTDILLDEATFLVLITGPNTGGKTVSLKTIGLMALMAQAGLHLPAVEARLSLFDAVYADIGDEQSIEQNLSTFSGHIKNITRILERVDDRSLVLLDELGSGTDPAEGAAIAQAIVNFLRDKGTTTFVATHYPELKVYASQTPGATNASLLFDEETLSPTFEMTIGLPGRSNAIAIARRLGLDETVIHDALGLIGQGSSQAESLLQSIYDVREKILSDEAASRVARRQAEQERDELGGRLAQIEAERAEILAAARRQAAAELERFRSEIRQMQRQMRDAATLTRMRQLKREAEALETELTQRPEPEPAVTAGGARPVGGASSGRSSRSPALMVGDTVLVKTLKVSGQILSLDRQEAEVAVGRLRMRTPLKDLEFKERPEEPEPEPAPAGLRSDNVGMELDLRGLRVEEGLGRLDRYLDQAYLADLPWVRIIHGKGTGRMRSAVRRALDQHPHVSVWEEGQDGEGGAGVTVARFGQA